MCNRDEFERVFKSVFKGHRMTRGSNGDYIAIVPWAAWKVWQADRAQDGEADKPVMEYHNSPSGMHVVWETLPYGKHFLYTHPSASMPNLSAIAQKKLDQMGATIHGVLVKNESGAWAAVSDAGRVMWLDDFEGRSARAQEGGSGEAVATINEARCFSLEDANRIMKLPPGTKLYTHPSASVPSDWIADIREAAKHIAEFESGPSQLAGALYRISDGLRSTPTTPQPADNKKKLQALRDSINGDCYMGEEWELKTIDELLSPPAEGAE